MTAIVQDEVAVFLCAFAFVVLLVVALVLLITWAFDWMAEEQRRHREISARIRCSSGRVIFLDELEQRKGGRGESPEATGRVSSEPDRAP